MVDIVNLYVNVPHGICAKVVQPTSDMGDAPVTRSFVASGHVKSPARDKSDRSPKFGPRHSLAYSLAKDL